MEEVFVLAVYGPWPKTSVNEAQPPLPNHPFATIFFVTEKPSTTQVELLLAREGVRNETQKSKFQLSILIR